MIIPFFIPHDGCPHQCVFCDQKRITGRAAAPDPASLPGTIREHFASQKRDSGAEPGPAEVAFYGGTFTSLAVGVLRSYLEQVRPFIATGAVRSIRVSTRPDAIDADILTLLAKYHVATVELGAQSMDDEVLRRSGRGHIADQTREAVRLLKEHGFRVGIQLMPGLPADTPATFHRTVGEVIGLGPDLVRIYPALVLSGTPLERLYRDGQYRPLSLDDAVTLCADAAERFRHAGIEVARMGLQSAEELERTGTIVAGPWHPAFGQLVASQIYLGRMRTLLAERNDADLLVHPDDLSTALGQHRANIDALTAELGRSVTIRTDRSVPRGEVRVSDSLA